MDINRYNTRIRQAVSDKYVECGKRIAEIHKEESALQVRLTRFMDGIDNIPYQEYIDIRSSLEQLHMEEHIISIRRDVWSEARELCLDIADEMDE